MYKSTLIIIQEKGFAMSEKKKSLYKMEKQDTPDSTTKFFEGEEVFVQNNDQFILGQIKEIDVAAEKCLVDINSDEALWASFRDLKPWMIDIDESEIKCNICKSSHTKENNVVVSCEICSRGYHQKCHQPSIDSSVTNWMCKKCRKKQNCQEIDTIATQKTVCSIPKVLSLPQSCNDLSYIHGKKKYTCYSIHASANSFKGQRVCIKSVTPSYSNDEQRKATSKVKKKNHLVENKNSHSACDVLPELPPTPPSSISAPETPQPLTVNGEFVSPTDDVTFIDFSDTSRPTYLATCTLQELFDSREQPSNITLPLQLNNVIVEPVRRPTKRILSEKDFKITADGGVVVKKRRRLRRLSSVGIRSMESRSRSALQTPVKTFQNSTADLKTLVHSYFNDECKGRLEGENEKVQEFVVGEDYRVCGKRTTTDGRVQYLIEWVKCTDSL